MDGINQNEEIQISITIQVMDMYRFMLRHAYRGLNGLINFIISAGALALFFAGIGKGDAFSRVLLLLTASLFTIINPLFLFYKAAKQVKLSPVFQKPLQYSIRAAGILVRQDGEELAVTWEEVRKIKETKKDIYIYLSLTRAYIFPKHELGGKMDVFQMYLKKYAGT